MRTRLCMRACVALCVVVFGGWSQGFAKETNGSEIEDLKKQMALMEEQLRFLRKKVDQLEAKPAAAPEPAKPAPTVAEERFKQLEEKVDAAVSASKLWFVEAKMRTSETLGCVSPTRS